MGKMDEQAKGEAERSSVHVSGRKQQRVEYGICSLTTRTLS